MERTVRFENEALCYVLERKPVKNLNLRIRKDCKVYVSAHPRVPLETVDRFVISKGSFIRSAQKRFWEMARSALQPRQYVSGETFYFLGKAISLKVEKGERDSVSIDGDCLRLRVRDPGNFAKKERMVKRYLDEQCRDVFGEIMTETFPVFEKYGVAMPTLRIRDMRSRWGSCMVNEGIVTLNKRLLEAPRSCIAYVVMHEYCHFIHPNHSKNFYDFLTIRMPDWKERKTILNGGPASWL